ncbi:MAG: hypothetical protein KAU50_04790, partial [Candidatus Marinimicrobia bacterium]|nr:hypothetical protein [Candidatus Neomarinimicrobiota bacterium]
KRTRELIAQAEHLFLEKGMEAIPEVNAIKEEQYELRAEASDRFPLSKEESIELLNGLHERLEIIAGLEEEAIKALKMAG